MWCMTVRTARPGFPGPLRGTSLFLEISIYLWIIEKGQYITDLHLYMKQGVLGQQELLVKSYNKARKCTWFVCPVCIWWHPYYFSPLLSCYQAGWASSVCFFIFFTRGECWSLLLSSIVTHYRPWRHITQHSAMDLSRCLEPALFRLFPIRQAASAGPQPAREWKSLARVIFGKCRVHRNPAAWSPVSARHPRLTITKERCRHCAAPACRWVVESSSKIAQQ